MDDACRRFFTTPEQTFHRRYEALRAFFLEGLSLDETATKFGYRVAALKSTISRFRAACGKGQSPPFFFATDEDAPRADEAARTSTAPNAPRSPIVGS